MPLTPRYTWEEDAASIALQINLPGAALKNVDIYISDLVVKVNVAPYVLLVDLFEAVEESSAVIKRNVATHVLHVTVSKIESKLWGQLSCEDSKSALKARRLLSMDRKSQAEMALSEKRKERKYQEEKQTLRAQMAVDDANRQILSDLKSEEKAREEQAMYESFKELKMKELHEKQPAAKAATSNSGNQRDGSVPSAVSRGKASTKKRVSFVTDSTGDVTKTTQHTGKASVPVKEEEEILELNADGSFDIARAPPVKPDWKEEQEEKPESEDEIEDIDSGEDNQVESTVSPIQAALKAPEKVESMSNQDEEAKVVVEELPPPRAASQAEIKFTPRLFPTPSRESKAAEEEDWLLKNRKHLKKHQGLRGAAAAAYDISESDPAWLKAKGDDFYRSRDYRSAVNAYTEASSVAADDQTDLLTSCLSNRAASYLQLGEFEKCLGDCSKALSHLPDTPEASATAQSATGEDHARVIREFRLKLKLLARRGTALCRLGKFTEAKADYGVALTMDKQNPALQYDYYQLLQLEQSQHAKERGDESFKRGELDDAIANYDESLRLHPHSIACLSNRAACFLRRHELQKCVDDCSTALQLLQQQPVDGGIASEGGSGIAFFAVGPAPGTAKRREWVVKTLVRRGTAHVAMQQLSQAADDYAAAVELDPSNSQLQADLNKIRQQLQGDERESNSKIESIVADPITVAP